MWKLFEGFKILCIDFDHILKKTRGNYSRGDITQGTKDQIKPQADLCTVDSPKKRTTEFGFLFAVKRKKQIRSFVFWENLRRANLLTVLSDL